MTCLLVVSGVYTILFFASLYIFWQRHHLNTKEENERTWWSGFSGPKVKKQLWGKLNTSSPGQSPFVEHELGKDQDRFHQNQHDEWQFHSNRTTRHGISHGKPPTPGKGESAGQTADRGQTSTSAKRPDSRKGSNSTLSVAPPVQGGTTRPQFANGTQMLHVANATSLSHRYLIFICDKKRSCGGWGDRQRGLLSVFLLSQVTGRRFGIKMSKPCDLTQLYVPNKYSWIVPDEELQGKSVRYWDDMNGSGGYNRLLNTIDFNQQYPEEVIYIRTNVDYFYNLRNNKLYYPKIFPKWSTNSQSVMFRNGWKILMKPSDHLQEHLDAFLSKVSYYNRTQPFVCIHFRMGRSSTMKNDAFRHNLTEVLDLWRFVDPYVNNGSRFFLATDSEEARNLTRKRFGDRVVDTGGRIVHVDLQAALPFSCEGLEVALLEQLVLMHCDVLVISNSMFSYIAAVVRGSNDNLYRLSNNGLHKFSV
ncbi:hypothetical protein C0Q70_03220 [Pomacea canaliculata]|uniref:Peptide-O-fucosyltransferase n=2 Tax=Pomacea canaliculata TaxID=400727 RepID=A0A2T7PS38_POMCA|nr:uncharacterized protein LOC112556751 isoform X2 [Pomacea canaliculata]XP_025081875.1 uncharacterized protein LOC112556751 isoform X2 [Pomacea canaliculata]PVD36242.1 hypothetical protein C0Q70_03220 [Pomacea canaliculata]